MSSKYGQLKSNLKTYEQMYGEGIFKGTLQSARLAINDLEEELTVVNNTMDEMKSALNEMQLDRWNGN